MTHQTAARSQLSDSHLGYRQRWLDLHGSWDHHFYDDAACREFLYQERADLLNVYDGYGTAIQRVDLFRVVAVSIHGGFYLDLDMICHDPLDSLCSSGCVLALENTLTETEARQLGHRRCRRVANYMFGSRPGHPFWEDVLEEMRRRSKRLIRSEMDVLESTGPGLISDVYHAVEGKYPDLVLLESDKHCDVCKAPSCQFGRFASHLHEGSWRWEEGDDNALSVEGFTKRVVDYQDWVVIVDRVTPYENVVMRSLPEVVILKTYEGQPYDGLSAVFALVEGLGTLVDDSSRLTDAKVLVPGIPSLYTDRLSSRNYNIVYTTYEASKLPPDWVETINRYYHHCLVPHASIRDIFLSSGVRIPVSVAQQGYPRYPRHERRLSKGLFRVGFLGVPVQRKNLLHLFEACDSLVESIPSLKLVVHVPHYYDWMDSKKWQGVRKAPFVEWTEGKRSPQQVSQWYSGLNCYVYPSSGEGWSFTPRESLYLGVPTLLSDIPVHRELIASGYCNPIRTRGLQNAETEFGTHGHWARVDVDDIRATILRLFENQDEAESRAQYGSRWIQNRWRNEDTCQQVAHLLRNGTEHRYESTAS